MARFKVIENDVHMDDITRYALDAGMDRPQMLVQFPQALSVGVDDFNACKWASAESKPCVAAVLAWPPRSRSTATSLVPPPSNSAPIHPRSWRVPCRRRSIRHMKDTGLVASSAAAKSRAPDLPERLLPQWQAYLQSLPRGG
jgi:hypothetical protein